MSQLLLLQSGYLSPKLAFGVEKYCETPLLMNSSAGSVRVAETATFEFELSVSGCDSCRTDLLALLVFPPCDYEYIQYSYRSACTPIWIPGMAISIPISNIYYKLHCPRHKLQNFNMVDEKVILVIGSCGLDRLLSVTTFPDADDKVRTTAYNEVGGGNAANTASAMALLKDSKFLAEKIVIKLLTKLGDDYVGKQLAQELIQAGVDLTSPLFLYAGRGTTTAFTTIIVSDSEFTRTCIHTPGTCGELTLDDLDKVDLEDVFENVIHLHSDCRHTDISLALATEARRRDITVSVDAEKDRNIASQHELLELATTIFMNSKQLHEYFALRTNTLEAQHDRPALQKPKVNCSIANDVVANTLCNSIHPSAFYLRWFGESQLEKEVVITKGSIGALRIKPESYETAKTVDNNIAVHSEVNDHILIDYSIADGNEHTSTRYKIETSGVLKDVHVVDTTGAGDAFMGGYLMVARTSGSVQLALDFGSWVGGKKVEGPGARSALPRASQVDEQLGCTPKEVEENLKQLVGSFGEKL